MNIVVIGGTGKIGRAIAYDLSRNDKLKKVGIVATDKMALSSTQLWLNSDKVSSHIADVSDSRTMKQILDHYDVGVIALPNRKLSYQIIDLAIDCKLDCVDILEEYHRFPEENETEGLELPKGMTLKKYGEYLHEKAMTNGVTILDGMGFAPGLSNITLAHGIRQLDKPLNAIARVGGIPDKTSAQRHPLKYMITWSFEHVLREYMVETTILKNGSLATVNALDDQEEFNFNAFGQKEKLECFITPGMPSFIHTFPDLQFFAEKTIRWPGHRQAIQTLKECGLLNLTPIQYEGNSIVPRQFLSACVQPLLQSSPEDKDVCVMYNTIEGLSNNEKKIIQYAMWEQGDSTIGLSAMARITGFTAAIGAAMLGENLIPSKGIVPPEKGIDENNYSAFIKELGARNIRIKEHHGNDH